MRLLITGGSGVLGRSLRQVLPDALAPDHEELDLTDREKVTEYVHRNKIDAVIHAAAMTDIRGCEEFRELAYKANVQATRFLIDALESAYFLYVSTACVFSGDDESHFYDESDLPYPKHYYGLTKLLSEQLVSEVTSSNLSTLTIRTNFVERGRWKYPRAFVDRFGTYLYADQVAAAVRTMVLESRPAGLVHICGDQRISMYELARLVDPQVRPMTLEDYSGPPLTVNMCLSSRIVRPLHLA